MQTPSHLLIGLTIRKARPTLAIPASAAAWGSVAPDIPLYLLSIGGFAWYRGLLGWSMPEASAKLFDVLYFEHPAWIASHNMLHAPLILIAGLAFLQLEGRWRMVVPDLAGVRIDDRVQAKAAARRRWWSTFLLFCLVHALIDIATHHDDGPLLLFPFDWSTRFLSPVSYWDPRHFGRPFLLFEATLDLVIAGWLLAPRWKAWRSERAAVSSRPPRP